MIRTHFIPRSTRLLIVGLIAAALLSVAAYAQLGGATGVIIPFQGQLELDGEAVDAPDASFRFTLWDAATGGTPCPTTYEEPAVVRGGQFSVDVGPVEESCVMGKPVYLAVEVDGGAGFTPLVGRQRVYPALGAMTSGVGDFFIKGALQVAGALDVIGDAVLGRVRVTSTEDVALNQGGPLVVGSGTGLNVAIDGNEIMARNNGAASPLHLNADGGQVNVGGNLVVTGNLRKASGPGLSCIARESALSGNGDDATVSVSCEAGEMLTSCSCFGNWKNCDGARPSPMENPNVCTAQNGTGGDRVTANVICCKLN